MNRQIRPGQFFSELILTRMCTVCREEFDLTVTKRGYNSWLNGTPIQNALPSLSPDERELLISGTCGGCFDKLHGEVIKFVEE